MLEKLIKISGFCKTPLPFLVANSFIAHDKWRVSRPTLIHHLKSLKIFMKEVSRSFLLFLLIERFANLYNPRKDWTKNVEG